jgi:hypothetical protein
MHSCNRSLGDNCELDRVGAVWVGRRVGGVGVAADRPGWASLPAARPERSAVAAGFGRADAARAGTALVRGPCGAPMWACASRWIDEGSDPV